MESVFLQKWFIGRVFMRLMEGLFRSGLRGSMRFGSRRPFKRSLLKGE
jgi:hypothetical protein